MEETKKALETDGNLTRVVFVCFGEQAYATYNRVFGKVFNL